MIKDIYPCYRKEIENLLNETKYFSKKENTWRNIIHMSYCSFITKKGSVCCTKIKDEGNTYCKHHRPKNYFILCSYNNCKNKCRIFGDFCHKHKKYNFSNNINLIEDNIFNYNIHKKYNNVGDWRRYINWYKIKKEDLLINKRIIIKDYIKDSNYNENSFNLVNYFDYNKYMIKIINKIYEQLKTYISNGFNQNHLVSVLILFYNFYQTSYFKNFHKNNKMITISFK